MTLSVQVVVDNCPPEMLDRTLLYLQRTQQPSVGITAGAQLDLGMQYVERVRRELPTIEILWRNLEIEDTGILVKYGAGFVYHKKVAPHLDWFKRNRVVFVPDNETSGDDTVIRNYVTHVCEMTILLHSENLRGAYYRFATGNIADGSQPGQSNQYPLLKPLFSILLPGDYISPNEYSAQPGFPGGSGGHLARYENFVKVAERDLPFIIGEAGIAMNYDPGKGYDDAGMSAEQMAQQLLDEEVWYKDGKIARHVYLVGGFTHQGYRLTPAAFDYWEKHYRDHPIVIQPPPPSPPPLPAFPPDFAERANRGAAIVQSPVNVRLRPELTAPIIDLLRPDTIAQFIPLDQLKDSEKIESLIDGKAALWQPVSLNGAANVKGWVWSGLVTWKPIPPYNVAVLTLLLENLLSVSTRTRQISLELAGISDGLLKDAELLRALIQFETSKVNMAIPPVKE